MAPAKPLIVAVLLGIHSAAGAFELNVSDPELNLSVPGVPTISVRERSPSLDTKRTLSGSDGTYTVEVEMSRQSSEMSARTCAGLLLRALLANPGMPNRDNVYRAPLDVSTFLVIYALGEGQQQKLHAHIISSAGKSHCANVHFMQLGEALLHRAGIPPDGCGGDADYH